MQNLSVRRTSDLLPSAGQAVESLLGRELADDEEVGIWASSPHDAPSGLERKEAWERLTQHLDVMASKVSTTAVQEIEGLADEIADEVRHGRGREFFSIPIS